MAKSAQASAEDLLLLRLIDEEYTRRKRVQRLMRQLGLAGMAPGPNTSRPHPQAEVYPYLLRGVAVERPNQVWSTDITYIRMARGFVYLVAVMDWYSRKVLAWRLRRSCDARGSPSAWTDTVYARQAPAQASAEDLL
jgi:putative transposase